MKTILVVDDEPAVRQLYRDALEEEGHCVLEAEGAGTALTLLRTETVDLAVLDIQMPGTHGLELLTRIHRAWPRLPVVLCSGLPKLFDDYAVWDAMPQIAGLFGKPVAIRSLLEAVRRAFTAPAPKPSMVGAAS